MAPASISAGCIRPVQELFTGAVSALWATTYNVDLSLFNEFLLPRLGEPPLNVVVLADQRRLAASLERLPADAVDGLATVNRRWLLRGVRLGGQAFHPKTYMAVTGSRATLLVGSGNLSMHGFDRGREVFTTFRSGTAVGDAALGAWHGWIRRVVEHVGDLSLARRLEDLETRLPPAAAGQPATVTPLLHNFDTPLAEQFAATVRAEAGSAVDELMVTAPYYDEDAEALSQLITDLQPRRIRVFLTTSTSVDGSKLATRLAASGADTSLVMYQPDEFVHAKLIAAVARRHAWLLSGSANLSRAALTRTVRGGGNAETAVVARLAADDVRELFTPPGMVTVEASHGQLATLSFRVEPEQEAPAVLLKSAAAVDAGRVRVITEPPACPGWVLDDLTHRQPLTIEPSGTAVTVGPIPGRLVRLVDDDGTILSNPVVVDDPTALAAALTSATSRPAADLPDELTSGDLDSPLGQALAWLHRNLVMDVSDRATGASSGGVAENEAAEQNTDDLWTRLEREQLARDPRAGQYARILAATDLNSSGPIIELLEALRVRTPTEPGVGRTGRSLLATLLDQPTDDDDESPPPRRWQLAARVRVRARNLLRRWADAQTNPRLAWVDPLAPVGNFVAIVLMFAILNLDQAADADQVELTTDVLDELWLRWLRGFTGDGTGNGWFDQLDQDTRQNAQRGLPEWLAETAAALCWLTIRPGSDYRERVVTAQPILTAALKHSLINPSEETARYLSFLEQRTISQAQVDEDILRATTYIDDALWCQRTAADLGLDGLQLQAPPGAASIQVRLNVAGICDPLLDPRLPRLLTAVRTYRRCTGLAVYAADDSWRLSLTDGNPIAVVPGLRDPIIESVEDIGNQTLLDMSASAGVLADLFTQHGAASGARSPEPRTAPC